MSKVYQCDRCKIIFKPRTLKNGDLYIARINGANLDLCPTCYEALIEFKNNKVENKCATCRFKAYKSTALPCKECCYSHDSCYEQEDNENEEV